MLNYQDNQLIEDKNLFFSMAALSVIGDRTDQQDSFGYKLKHDEGLIVLCDGMGGYEGGKLASDLAVDCFLKGYSANMALDNKTDLLIDTAKKADSKITALKDSNGKALKAGSTLVSIIIKKNQLIWCSVGDSRAYLMRDNEFVQLTQDHNYFTVLKEKKNAGLITEQEYSKEAKRGEALISFLGIGNLELIDHSAEPFALKKDDKIIIMSDGLYKTVAEEEIQRIIDNFSNIGEAVLALEMKMAKNARIKKIKRDNATIALIKIV